MEEKQKPNQKGIKKHRSPNYPYIGLDDALTRTRQIQAAGGIFHVPFTAVMDVWGYKVGTTNSVIAALKSYGLVEITGEGEKRQIRVSESGRKILDDHSECDVLLKEAALKPSLYREIWDKYEGNPPPSNKVIAEYLKFERKFNPAVVDSVIDQFRATIAFAKLSPSDIIIGDDENADSLESEEVMHAGQAIGRTNIAPPILSSNTPPPKPDFTDLAEDVLSFNLSRTGKAQVRFNGQITQEGIKKLIALLDLSVDTYPTQAELIKPKQAMWRNKDHDQPVTVTGELGEKDGKKFYAIEESSTGISEDELEFQE